jgi:hypothetical protein
MDPVSPPVARRCTRYGASTCENDVYFLCSCLSLVGVGVGVGVWARAPAVRSRTMVPSAKTLDRADFLAKLKAKEDTDEKEAPTSRHSAVSPPPVPLATPEERDALAKSLADFGNNLRKMGEQVTKESNPSRREYFYHQPSGLSDL